MRGIHQITQHGIRKMTNKVEPENTNWLKVAVGATIIYLVVIIRWIGTERLVVFLKTDELNAFGDFLAGVFAPLAFLWLTAAVITQRQELNETRDQFEENQKVVDAQMKTIKAQNKLLSVQHTQAQESAKQTYKLNLFDKRFEIYEEMVALGHRLQAQSISHEHVGSLHSIRQKSRFVFGLEVESYLGGVLSDMIEHVEDREKIDRLRFTRNSINGAEIDSEIARLTAKTAASDKELISKMEQRSLTEILWTSMYVNDEPSKTESRPPI